MSDSRAVLQLENALHEIGRTAVYPPMPDPTDAVLAAIAMPRRRQAAIPIRIARPALIALALLLAIAGAAVAYLLVTGWQSTGPRGIQFSDSFAFEEVYRDPGTLVRPGPFPISEVHGDFASADGLAIFGVEMPSYPAERDAVLVRFTGLGEDVLRRDVVLALADLTAPGLWDEGVDAAAARVGVLQSDDALAVAPGGQIFVVAAAYGRDRIPIQGADAAAQEIRANWSDLPSSELEEQIQHATTTRPLLGASVIVTSPDGHRQRVLTLRDLAEAGMDAAERGPLALAIAASAPGRLWVRATAPDRPGESGDSQLFQVLDDNSDGDWSDRRIVPVALPDSIPAASASVRYLQPVAEQSSPAVDRAGSVLLPVIDADNTYRVYRVTDVNLDGDAADAGEAIAVFTFPLGVDEVKAPSLTSRVVVDGDDEVLREFLVSGVTRPTRIARVGEDGSVRDIARAIRFGPTDVVAVPTGEIFVMVQEPIVPDATPALVVYRLTPEAHGAHDQTDTAVGYQISEGRRRPDAP